MKIVQSSIIKKTTLANDYYKNDYIILKVKYLTSMANTPDSG